MHLEPKVIAREVYKIYVPHVRVANGGPPNLFLDALGCAQRAKKQKGILPYVERKKEHGRTCCQVYCIVLH